MVQLLLQFRGGDLFVTTLEAGIINGAKVAEYDATSGAVVNDSLITGLNGPEGHHNIWHEPFRPDFDIYACNCGIHNLRWYQSPRL